MPEPPPTPRSWLVRAATSAGPVKTLAGAIAAIIGLVAVVLPLLGGGGTDRAAAEIVRARFTQPFSREDFERIPRGDRAAEPRSVSAAVDRESASWPGAWVRLRIRLAGIEETRFTWAVLRAGTNELIFTSADAHVNPAGPAASRAGTTVLADVWVPFPTRAGRYVVVVSLLPTDGDGLDEYVSPPFRVARPPGGGGDGGGAAPASPLPSPTPPLDPVAPDRDLAPVPEPPQTSEQPPEAPEPEPGPATTTAEPPEAPLPVPHPSPPGDLPDIEVPDPTFSATS